MGGIEFRGLEQPSAPIDLEILVRTAAFQLLVQRAQRISPAQLATTTGIRRDKLDNLVGRLAQAGCIRVDAAGMVLGSAGLSVTPDRHEIEVGGRRFWTWCAYDFFGIFGALGASGRAASPSPPNGTPIEVHFAGGRPRAAQAVLFRPDTELMACCDNVYEEWCPNSNLFANRELAETWAAAHNLRGSVLSLDEAADLATEEWKSVTNAKVSLPGDA